MKRGVRCVRAILTSVGSLPRLADSPDEAILKAVQLQQDHGLELLTDGEQRGDMLSMYATLPGVRSEAGMPRFIGPVRPVEDSASFAKIRDLDVLRAKFPEARFKVSLTGPTTFAVSCGSAGAGPTYRSAMDPVLHDDIAAAIRPLAHEVGRRGAELQLDDPILSQGMRDYAPVLARIDAIASEVPRDRASLHVCGGLARGKVLDALQKLENISTFNFAFAGAAERENIALLARRTWEERDRFLGVGCIPVQVMRAEDIADGESVARVLKDVTDRIGLSRVRYVLPDCGLRATAPELVPKVLENLRQGYRLAFPAGD
jgi:methionine synthase II (cobalamin-independent)